MTFGNSVKLAMMRCINDIQIRSIVIIVTRLGDMYHSKLLHAMVKRKILQ